MGQDRKLSGVELPLFRSSDFEQVREGIRLDDEWEVQGSLVIQLFEEVVLTLLTYFEVGPLVVFMLGALFSKSGVEHMWFSLIVQSPLGGSKQQQEYPYPTYH